jgi:hypothetical protein
MRLLQGDAEPEGGETMKRKGYLALLVSLTTVCAVAVLVGAARPDMGVLIHGPFGDVYYVFPKGQETILFRFGGDGAAFSILTDTNALSDELSVVASGQFAGSQTTAVGSLDREIGFTDPCSMEWSTAIADALASFSFSADEGTCGQGFSTDEVSGADHIYISIDIAQASDMWVYVVDGKPKKEKEPKPKPKLKLAAQAMTQIAGAGGALQDLPLQLTIVNEGDGAFVGDITAAIGLAYYPGWVPESVATYAIENLGSGVLEPGESVTVSVSLPPITPEAMSTFRAQRLFYGSGVDRDPERDYVGVVLHCGDDTLFTWVPIMESVPTVAMRKG